MSTANGTDIIEEYQCRLWEAKDSVCSMIKSVIEIYGLPYFPNGRDQETLWQLRNTILRKIGENSG